jgi:hypothetical protein
MYQQFVYFNRFIFVALYDLITKGSVAVPIVTAIGPTMVIPTLLTLQIIFNIAYNDWFAEGNVFLVVMQIFTIIQFVNMFLLIWDTEFYLYTVRLYRYIIFAIAIVFCLVYVADIAVAADLIWGIDEWQQQPAKLAVNGLVSTILAYCAIEFLPTFAINW